MQSSAIFLDKTDVDSSSDPPESPPDSYRTNHGLCPRSFPTTIGANRHVCVISPLRDAAGDLIDSMDLMIVGWEEGSTPPHPLPMSTTSSSPQAASDTQREHSQRVMASPQIHLSTARPDPSPTPKIILCSPSPAGAVGPTQLPIHPRCGTGTELESTARALPELAISGISLSSVADVELQSVQPLSHQPPPAHASVFASGYLAVPRHLEPVTDPSASLNDVQNHADKKSPPQTGSQAVANSGAGQSPWTLRLDEPVPSSATVTSSSCQQMHPPQYFQEGEFVMDRLQQDAPQRVFSALEQQACDGMTHAPCSFDGPVHTVPVSPIEARSGPLQNRAWPLQISVPVADGAHVPTLGTAACGGCGSAVPHAPKGRDTPPPRNWTCHHISPTTSPSLPGYGERCERTGHRCTTYPVVFANSHGHGHDVPNGDDWPFGHTDACSHPAVMCSRPGVAPSDSGRHREHRETYPRSRYSVSPCPRCTPVIISSGTATAVPDPGLPRDCRHADHPTTPLLPSAVGESLSSNFQHSSRQLGHPTLFHDTPKRSQSSSIPIRSPHQGFSTSRVTVSSSRSRTSRPSSSLEGNSLSRDLPTIDGSQHHGNRTLASRRPPTTSTVAAVRSTPVKRPLRNPERQYQADRPAIPSRQLRSSTACTTCGHSPAPVTSSMRVPTSGNPVVDDFCEALGTRSRSSSLSTPLDQFNAVGSSSSPPPKQHNPRGIRHRSSASCAPSMHIVDSRNELPQTVLRAENSRSRAPTHEVPLSVDFLVSTFTDFFSAATGAMIRAYQERDNMPDLRRTCHHSTPYRGQHVERAPAVHRLAYTHATAHPPAHSSQVADSTHLHSTTPRECSDSDKENTDAMEPVLSRRRASLPPPAANRRSHSERQAQEPSSSRAHHLRQDLSDDEPRRRYASQDIRANMNLSAESVEQSYAPCHRYARINHQNVQTSRDRSTSSPSRYLEMYRRARRSTTPRSHLVSRQSTSRSSAPRQRNFIPTGRYHRGDDMEGEASHPHRSHHPGADGADDIPTPKMSSRHLDRLRLESQSDEVIGASHAAVRHRSSNYRDISTTRGSPPLSEIGASRQPSHRTVHYDSKPTGNRHRSESQSPHDCREARDSQPAGFDHRMSLDETYSSCVSSISNDSLREIDVMPAKKHQRLDLLHKDLLVLKAGADLMRFKGGKATPSLRFLCLRRPTSEAIRIQQSGENNCLDGFHIAWSKSIEGVVHRQLPLEDLVSVESANPHNRKHVRLLGPHVSTDSGEPLVRLPDGSALPMSCSAVLTFNDGTKCCFVAVDARGRQWMDSFARITSTM